MAYNTGQLRFYHCVIAVGVLTIALLSQIVDASQATNLSDDQREASIRSLLEFCTGPTDFQQSIEVTFTEKRIPWETKSEIEAKLSRLKNRPDHPDRQILEFQLSMFDQPSKEIFYCMSPNGDWIFVEDGVRYAQFGDLRWLLSRPKGGQLSITKAGVPYPSSFEIGRIKSVLLSHHRRHFYAGFSERIKEISFNELNTSAVGWSAEVSVSDRDQREIAVIKGSWVDSSPVVSTVRSKSDDSPQLFEQIDFDSHDSNKELSPFSFSMSSRRSDDFSRSTTEVFVTMVRSPNDDEVEALVSVPSIDSIAASRDFRKPRSASHDLYADAGLTTWSKSSEGDVYETNKLESDYVHTTESVATVRRKFRWAAIALTATVLVAGLLLRYRSR